MVYSCCHYSTSCYMYVCVLDKVQSFMFDKQSKVNWYCVCEVNIPQNCQIQLLHLLSNTFYLKGTPIQSLPKSLQLFVSCQYGPHTDCCC